MGHCTQSVMDFKFNLQYFGHNLHSSYTLIRNIKGITYSLYVNLTKYKLYLQDQNSNTFKGWAAYFRINLDFKSSMVSPSQTLCIHFGLDLVIIFTCLSLLTRQTCIMLVDILSWKLLTYVLTFALLEYRYDKHYYT